MEKLLSSCEYHPYKSFGSLGRGEYPVKKFSMVETKYGHRVKVDLKEFYVYLPARFAVDQFTAEVLDELNEQDIVMIYNGKGSEPNSRYVFSVVI